MVFLDHNKYLPTVLTVTEKPLGESQSLSTIADNSGSFSLTESFCLTLSMTFILISTEINVVYFNSCQYVVYMMIWVLSGIPAEATDINSSHITIKYFIKYQLYIYYF